MRAIFIILFLVITIFANDECKELLIKMSGSKKEREVFIIVDQTTPFPENIRKNAIVNIFGLIKSKTMVNLFTFSEYTKGKSISLLDRYYFHSQLTKEQRYEMGKKSLNTFDECFESQTMGMRKKLTSDILDSFKEGEVSSSRSEILYTLKKISEKAVKLSNAKQKIVVIISDMLENSNFTSFYAKELKSINIDKQLNIMKKNNLFGDFDSADVIVVGAGIVDKENYRDGIDFDNLENIWKEYFKNSNAKLVTFEQELKYPLKEMY